MKTDPILSKIPVILLTAVTDKASQQKGFDMGISDYLVKPLSVSDIRNTLGKYLGSP